MNHVFKAFLSLTLILSSPQVFSHGGEDHGPLSKIAPKGGVLKETEKGHLELVAKDESLNLYYYDLKIEPKKVKDADIKLFVKKPRQEEKELELSSRVVYWSAPFDKKSSHRFNVKVTLNGETFTWTVD